MGIANAILAYAAKVLKELHESQVVAGKGAGTMIDQPHLKQVAKIYEMQGSSGSIMPSKIPTTP